MDPASSKSDDQVQRFDAGLLALLNLSWPKRVDADQATADRARALSAQLRNWESWK